MFDVMVLGAYLGGCHASINVAELKYGLFIQSNGTTG